MFFIFLKHLEIPGLNVYGMRRIYLKVRFRQLCFFVCQELLNSAIFFLFKDVMGELNLSHKIAAPPDTEIKRLLVVQQDHFPT